MGELWKDVIAKIIVLLEEQIDSALKDRSLPVKARSVY